MSPSQKTADNPIRIVLTGGGSGGHIVPLLPLARALKNKQPDCQLIYIGLKGEKINIDVNKMAIFDQIARVSSGKFRRYHGESLLSHMFDIKTLLLNFKDVFKVLAGTFTAWRLLGRWHPAVIFSKGGYVVVPVGLAAKLRGVPIVTHDSDAVPGLANRIVGRWASLHTTGTPSAHYHYPSGKLIHTGIPVDESLQPVSQDRQREYKKQIGIAPDDLVLLVAGGGHGSRTINNLIIEISPRLVGHYDNLHIIHITGAGHQDSVAEAYFKQLGQPLAERVKVIGFANDFPAYSAAADVVVARAGASTLAELAIQQKATVIIPSPFLTGGHQLKNAEELTTHSAAEVLPNDVSAQELFNVLDLLLQNKQRRQTLAHNFGKLAQPEAANKLADILLDVAAPK